MRIPVTTTTYGAAAAAALREAVARHKADDPFSRVSVIVAANSVGVAARRRLATDSGPRGTGILAVNFLTVFRMAELLGAPRLAAQQRRPVSTPVLTATVRSVLAARPGVFGDVAEHAATEDALVRAHRELSNLSDQAVGRIARTGDRAADVVRIHRAIRTRLASDWFEERDLLDAAVDAIRAGSSVSTELGAIVLYLPQQLPPPALNMLRVASDFGSVEVIAGTTGSTRADAAVRKLVADLGGEWPPEESDALDALPAAPTEFVSASDADEEVREIVRRVFDAMREGVALHRMAILFASSVPYARLVHEQLDAADISYNGTAVRTLADCVLGRTLLGKLALGDRDFRRPDVIALAASAPLRFRGRPTPTARWERTSRRAGVVASPAQWQSRLSEYLRVQNEQLQATLASGDQPGGHLEREIATATSLQQFVAELANDLDPKRAPTSWERFAHWAHGLLHKYLGDERLRSSWPTEEQRAAGLVEAAIDRLASLDDIDTAPTLDVFRRTLAAELDTDLGRVGRLGEGILVAPISFGLGLDLDRVFLVGMAEGIFAPRRRDDSLLPDDERVVSQGELPLIRDRVHDDSRALLAALAATSGARVLSWPRGDLRRSTEHQPSRFLVPMVERLVGARVAARDLHDLNAPALRNIPSFIAGVGSCSFPSIAQHHHLRVLHEDLDHRDTIVDHQLVLTRRQLGLAVACIRARRGSEFTRFDGNLSGLVEQLPKYTDEQQVVSATRLERWASCPFDFLMEAVLRVEVTDNPEELLGISALEKGSLIHDTLERFVVEAIDAGGLAPGAPWSTQQRARLQTIGAAVCDEYERRGVTGRPLLWRHERRRILADLERALESDTEWRARHQLAPIAAEMRFALPGTSEPAVVVPLSDGRTLRFRGSADRVDLGSDGSLHVVDYKTGRIDPYKNFSNDDPDNGGTHLQLPIYAHAARAVIGPPESPVTASYWFCTTKGGFKRKELLLTDQVAARVDLVLRTIVDGIERGTFPCRLDEPSTRVWIQRSHADPDGLGTRDRYREWARKRDDPRLRDYRVLGEPSLEPTP